MVNQALFDELADLLVERGKRVTYDLLNEALRERDRRAGGIGQGKSDRDLQRPLADWKRRRRYRPHLAQLDLPEAMDKALASFVERAMSVAAQHTTAATSSSNAAPVEEPDHCRALANQLDEFRASMQAQMAALVEESRVLRDQVGASIAGQSNKAVAPSPKREDRRRGLAAATSRFFWDRMMQMFAKAIRESGPMTADELYEILDEDALSMSSAAFEEIDVNLIRKKVEARVREKNYFCLAENGRYDLIRKRNAEGSSTGKR